MPLNRRYNMEALKKAMARYCEESGREILVAYVMIKGVNDALTHARELISYLDGLNVKVNVIPYNPQSRDCFACSDWDVIEAFTQALRSAGLQTLLRHSRGRDIMAACGQLGNLQLRRQLREKRSIVNA